jgi:hypothetical protein
MLQEKVYDSKQALDMFLFQLSIIIYTERKMYFQKMNIELSELLMFGHVQWLNNGGEDERRRTTATSDVSVFVFATVILLLCPPTNNNKKVPS